MNNPRWKSNQNQNVTQETASETESESDFDENEFNESQVVNKKEIQNNNSSKNLAKHNNKQSILETQESIEVVRRKRGRPKKVQLPVKEKTINKIVQLDNDYDQINQLIAAIGSTI